MSLLSIINKEKSGSGPSCAGDLISISDLGLYLPFNGSPDDESGNSNAITLFSTLTYDPSRNIENGQAVSLNGSPQRLDVASSSSTDLTSGFFSVSAWVYLTGTAPGGHHIVSFKTNSVGNSNVNFRIAVRDSLGDILVSANGSNLTFSNGNNGGFSLNTWYHIALTFDATNDEIKAFSNGTEIGNTQSIPGSLPVTKITPMTIGALYPGSNANTFFLGNLDELSTWQRVLTPAEILTLATSECPLRAEASCPPGAIISETDIVSYFNFNDNLDDQKGVVSHVGTGPGPNKGYVSGRNLNNGKGYYVASGQFETWDFPTEMQITGDKNWSMWCAPFIPAGTNSVFLTGNQTFSIRTEDGTDRIEFLLLDTNTNVNVATTTNEVAQTGIWNHLSVNYTYATGQVDIYFNGVLEGTGTFGSITPDNSSTALRVGNTGVGRGTLMDELIIYNRTLTPTEISIIAGNVCPFDNQ